MSNVIFNPTERQTLAALADVLIPAEDGFPAASEAGVADAGLDQVLTFRPDLVPGLKRLLAAAQGKHPGDFVASLPRDDAAAFSVLTELVPGAYFLSETVRARLGYGGQKAKPIDPSDDPANDELLPSVIARGPIFRPTPVSREHRTSKCGEGK
jgi:hypothetical protein